MTEIRHRFAIDLHDMGEILGDAHKLILALEAGDLAWAKETAEGLRGFVHKTLYEALGHDESIEVA